MRILRFRTHRRSDGSGPTSRSRGKRIVRDEYWVVPVERSWVVRHNGSDVERHQDKLRAVVQAGALARANMPSELIIVRRDGEIEGRRSIDV